MELEKKRWQALDLFKVIAMFLLVLVHCLIWLVTAGTDRQIGTNDPLWSFLVSDFFTYFGMIPMSLPITIGLSFRFMLNKYWENFENLSWMSVLKRSLVLFFLGTLANVMAWGWDEIWVWDILQFAAVSLIFVIFVLKYFNPKTLYTLGLVVLFGSQYLRDTILVKPEFYSNKFFIIILGDFEGDHFWPLFPWVFYVILGVFISSLFIKHGDRISNWLIASASATLMALSGLGLSINMQIDLKDIWGPNFMLPSAYTVLAIGSYAILLLGLLMKIKINSLVLKSIILRLSNQITLFFVVHLIVGANVTILLKQYFALSLPLLIGFWLALSLLVFSFMLWADKKINYKKYLSIK